MSSTKNTADYYLKRMADFSRHRKKDDWGRQKAAELAEKFHYIRIGGNGFRAVSIHPDQPCGELNGFPAPDESFSKVLKNLESLPVNNDPEKPHKDKKEHRLQAHLIRMALTRPDEMPRLLACDDIFDELVFVTDELNFDNKVRADLVFLGRKGKTYFPIFIELKAKRELKQLTKQLSNAERITKEFPKEATDFFCAAVAPDLILEDQQFEIHAPRSIIVWPRANDPARTSKNIDEWKNADAEHRYIIGFHAEKLASGNEVLNYTFSRE